jgi:hypothetical protein
VALRTRLCALKAAVKKINCMSMSDRSSRRDRTAIALLLLLGAGFAASVLVFYPGYITVDARYVYAEAKAWHFGDWQSPAMGVLWRLIDPLAPGSVGMFLLTVTLYWLSFGTLGFIALRSSNWLALATPLLALSPPAFFFIGLIWRDILFGVVWLFAAVLVFAAAERRSALRFIAQSLALFLIAFGVLLRPNAAIAAPLLAIYAIWPMRFGITRLAVAYVPAAIVFCGLVPAVYYGLLGTARQNPLHSIVVFDLGGITHFSGENQFPVQWTEEQKALLATRCYDPARWDSYWHVPPCPFVMQRLERADDPLFGRPRLLQAWWDAVTGHPLSYLAHRATFMWQFLARSNLVLPVWDWADPHSSYGHSAYMRPLLRLHDVLAPSILFRPGLWLLLTIGVGVFAWPAREAPAGAFAVAITSCAGIYVASFFVLGVAADFRYCYWCVLATLAGVVAAVITRCETPSTEQAAPPATA